VGRVPITVMGFHCERCEHEWIPRGENDDEPKVCPRCKTPYWNRPRTNVAGYEQFRDAIRTVLEANPDGMDWTSIRTAAKLPQRFPHNVWVRRLENDIGLVREPPAHGRLRRWQLH